MRISKITIVDFQKHERLEFEPHQRLTALVGSSDSGKTAVVRALRWVLCNEPAGTQMIRHGAAEARVVVEFEDGSAVERVRGRKSINRYVLRRGQTEEVIDHVGQGLPAPVRDFIGVDTHVEVRGDRVPLNFAFQKEAPFMVAMSPADRAWALRAITGDRLDEAGQMLKQRASEAARNEKAASEEATKAAGEAQAAATERDAANIVAASAGAALGEAEAAAALAAAAASAVAATAKVATALAGARALAGAPVIPEELLVAAADSLQQSGVAQAVARNAGAQLTAFRATAASLEASRVRASVELLSEEVLHETRASLDATSASRRRAVETRAVVTTLARVSTALTRSRASAEVAVLPSELLGGAEVAVRRAAEARVLLGSTLAIGRRIADARAALADLDTSVGRTEATLAVASAELAAHRPACPTCGQPLPEGVK